MPNADTPHEIPRDESAGVRLQEESDPVAQKISPDTDRPEAMANSEKSETPATEESSRPEKSEWASSNEQWQEGHSRVPTVSWQEFFTISDFRNFRHGKDPEEEVLSDGPALTEKGAENTPEPAFETRTYDLSKLEGMEIFSIPFGKTRKFSHLIASFAFSDGARLALSVEARRRPGESFSVGKGLVGHFGLSYVWGSEADLLGLRSLRRGEPLELYRFAFGKNVAEMALRHYLTRTAVLSERDETYHSLLKNCTTELLAPLLPGSLWKLSPDVVLSSWFWKRLRRKYDSPCASLVLPDEVAERFPDAGKVDEAEFSDALRRLAVPLGT